MNLIAPPVYVSAISRDELNRCLVAWGHKMGAFTRPSYAIEAHHALFHHGKPVAVTAASDTVRETVGRGLARRQDVVELARLCAVRPHLCRVMLRLWRELLLPEIAAAHGRTAAVSYQDEAYHRGDVYRFDGWQMIGKAGGGGRDARSGRPSRDLRVWLWTIEAAE